MENLKPVLIAGFSLFFAGAFFISLAYIHFCYTTRKAISLYDAKEYKIKLSGSIWIYLTLLNACLGFALLYLLQYFGQGFAIRPGFDLPVVIIWLRWLFYTAVGGTYFGLLNYALARKPHGGQSFFSTFSYVISMFAVFSATVSQSMETQACWIAFAVIWFLQAVLGLFWPLNRITGGEEYARMREILSSESFTRVLFRSKKDHEASVTLWAFIYRLLLLILILVSHTGLIITWFLDDANEFTDISDKYSTLLANLIFDAVLVMPFVALFGVLTFMGVVKKFSATKRSTGQKRIEAHPHTLFTS